MAQEKANESLVEKILPLTDEAFTRKEPWEINSLPVSTISMLKQGEGIQNVKLSYGANVVKKNTRLYVYLS